MLDDLRNSSSFVEDEEPEEENKIVRRKRAQNNKETFLGMTAPQRFVISLLLFLMVCVVGIFALLLTGSISLPF